MNKTHTQRFAGFLCLVLTGIFLAWGAQHTLAVDCEGKPYGFPGCPTKKEVVPGPPPATCGNGVVNDGEECDLGKNYNGLSNCTTDCRLLYCGDNIVSPSNDEECEPEKEERYVKNPSTGELEVEQRFLQPSCGSVCTVPLCDGEGNCSGGCKRKFLKACTTQGQNASGQTAKTNTTTTQAAICGDGKVQAGEECDDGNKINTDKCTMSCLKPACGDTFVQLPEQCDDGNDVDIDDCTNDCKLPSCGDGAVQVGEECDDGNALSDDECTTTCKKPQCGDNVMQTGEECDDGNSIDNDACTNACKKPKCGDGVAQTGEECDDGNDVNDDQCANSCRQPRCGDGIIQAGEDCDDSNRNPGDGCNNLCKLPSCGNAIREDQEECDDGNRLDGDACTNACKRPRCADGILQAGEECDDGNEVNDDTCTNNCRIMRCGDGIPQAGEECDDGRDNSNTKPDVCRKNCRSPRCGDNIVDSGEECDGGDTCTKECKTVHAAAQLLSRGGGGMTGLALMIGGAGILVFAVGAGIYLLKTRTGRLVGKAVKKGMASIDDIPLDEIEMPWHRWQ